jgi:hypothetical protein
MTFAGIAITKVGLSPRHRVRGPSFRAIFRSPSNVEVKVFRCVSSAAHAATDLFVVVSVIEMLGAATQKLALLEIQKTSLQQADMPRFGGALVKE